MNKKRTEVILFYMLLFALSYKIHCAFILNTFEGNNLDNLKSNKEKLTHKKTTKQPSKQQKKRNEILNSIKADKCNSLSVY